MFPPHLHAWLHTVKFSCVTHAGVAEKNPYTNIDVGRGAIEVHKYPNIFFFWEGGGGAEDLQYRIHSIRCRS